MPRLFVESWRPEYGAPVDPGDPSATPTVDPVDLSVELAADRWSPIDGDPEAVDRLDAVAFVDGIRRVDARLTLADADGLPVAGICASLAAGVVLWQARQRRTAIERVQVERRAIFAGGRGAALPDIGPDALAAGGGAGVGSPLRYLGEAVPTSDPAALVSLLQTRMRQYEGELTRQLAREGRLVVADGPIHPLEPLPLVGYVKSQRAAYLPPELTPVVAQLRPGQRTPLFIFDRERFARYSWYVRLTELRGVERGHPWAAVARCECTASMPRDEARRLADTVAALLPRFASSPHIDPRAPQNLVPVGALERQLRRLLGDPALVYRALRAALHGLVVQQPTARD